MKKVFLSYAREDLKIAKKIYNDLARKGINVWLDENALIPGQNWHYEITQAIKGSNYFLALLSSNSVSKVGYVQKELKMALDILDNYPQDKIFIIPVRVDDCEPVDEKLGALHWADLSVDYEAGIQKIQLALGLSESEALLSSARKTMKYPRRAKPIEVSEDEFNEVFKLANNRHSLKYVPNEYKNNGNGTISDLATGLMWQQSGSGYRRYKNAQKYVQKLNSENFAGYDDWRLPTIDELTSLIESDEQSNGLYIATVFDKKQRWCCSSDERSGGGAWHVRFSIGHVYWLYDAHYVRVCRS